VASASARTTLAQFSVRLDGVYFCPHHVDGVVAELAVQCACRKPQPGMLHRAAAELDLYLGGSWFIGDSLDDVEAGNRCGCRTILIDLGTEARPLQALRDPDFVARNTRHALGIVCAVEALSPTAELTYQPAGWGQAPNAVSTT
jgi:D-glycero-D-manno-heptose 1,7-bisphosphate phosphatase